MGKLYSALICLSMIWGTSFLFVKILLEHLGPGAVVFGRCFFGFATLALFTLVSRNKVSFTNLPMIKLFIVGLINNALPWLLISTGQTKISSSLASIINATTPIWTLIIGSLFFSAHLRKNQWIGIIFGFAGIFIISEITPGEFISGQLSGILFMIGAAVCYGAGTHLTKKYLKDVSTLHISLFTMLSATLISLVYVLFTAPDSLLLFNKAEILFPLIGLGSFGSGLAYLLYYFLVKQGSPEFASLVTYLVPGSAIIWGALLLKEEVHLTMIFGLLIIIAGVYLSSMKEKQHEKKAAA